MSSEGIHDPRKALADSQKTAEMWRQTCGALERELAEARAERDHAREYGVFWHDQALGYRNEGYALRDKLAAAERRERGLREALAKYGKHTGQCAGYPATTQAWVEAHCDCGLQAALTPPG